MIFTLIVKRCLKWNGITQLNEKSCIIPYTCSRTTLFPRFTLDSVLKSHYVTGLMLRSRATLKDLFIGRIRDVDVQQHLIKAKTDLDTLSNSRWSVKKGLARQPNFRSFFLIIKNQTSLKLNKNQLFQFSRPEGNAIILRINRTVKIPKVTKRINHTTSTVTLLV